MNNRAGKIIPVILCGGSGQRLWPLSREKAPKQFHPVLGETPLLHETLERAIYCSNAQPSEVITVTTNTLKKETTHQLADFEPQATTHLISEPMARNTAAAMAYTALYAQKHFGVDSVLWFLPADHHIKNNDALSTTLQEACAIAEQEYIVTFGMQPTRPETGYGYIKTGENMHQDQSARFIQEFVEKPDTMTAQKYIDEENYLWNSGMFVGSVRTILDNYIEYCPEILSPLHTNIKEHGQPTKQIYEALPALPFDVAIMEKTSKAAVIPCDIGWSDVGSWESVWELKQKDENGNVKSGHVTAVDTTNSLIQSNNLLIATLGLQDVVVVENGDSILIADKKNNPSMKTLVETLNKLEKNETIYPPMENRPWGQFKVLSEKPGYKVKEICVKPGQRLSLQMHHHRCEFWTIISGEALITINDEERTLKPQEHAFIPLKAKHRLENSGTEDLIIVEVQCGEYLGEDDIVRFDDIYGRTEVA